MSRLWAVALFAIAYGGGLVRPVAAAEFSSVIRPSYGDQLTYSYRFAGDWDAVVWLYDRVERVYDTERTYVGGHYTADIWREYFCIPSDKACEFHNEESILGYNNTLVRFLPDGFDLKIDFKYLSYGSCPYDGIATYDTCEKYHNSFYAIEYTTDSAVTYSLTRSPTPEPAAWALMIAGFGLAGWRLRERSRVGA
jgi:hypothetical protein